MDKAELQQNIAFYYSRLPKEAQEMFAKMEWLDKLKKISIKYALSENQTQTLATETTLIMLGIIPILEYEQVLLEEIKMPREFVQKMIQEVKDYVIRPVAIEITDAYERNTAPEKAAERERQKIEKALDERFAKLPKHIQEAIEASKYYDSLYEVGSKYNLTVSQMGTLEEVTTDVVTGSLPSERFERTLEERVGMSGSDASSIVKEINDRILKGIREKMMAQIPGKSTSAPVAIKKSEEFILNKAGIHINTPAPAVKLNTLELNSGKPMAPAVAPSGLAQKLVGSVQSSVAKTEHTISSPSKIYSGKDPYRLGPNE